MLGNALLYVITACIVLYCHIHQVTHLLVAGPQCERMFWITNSGRSSSNSGSDITERLCMGRNMFCGVQDSAPDRPPINLARRGKPRQSVA